MNCTQCKNPMMTAELEHVEVDFCGQCGGIWLDAGELESLLGEGLGRQLIASFTCGSESPEKSRKCPVCRKKMEKVRTGQASGQVLLDRCPNHGLWFDRGELADLLSSGAFDPQGKVVQLLKELFAN